MALPLQFATVMRFTSLLIASLSLAAGACTDSGSSADTEEQRQLDAAKQTYMTNEPAHYSFTLTQDCGECPAEAVEPIRITVDNDQITTALVLSTEEAPPSWRTLYTLRGLFDRVQNYLDNGAASVVVTYDSELGYPKQAAIDPIAGAVDDETGWTVSAFQVNVAN